MGKGVTATMEFVRSTSKTIFYAVFDKNGKEIGFVEKAISGADKGKVFCYALGYKYNRNYIQRVYNYYTNKETQL